MTRQSSFPHILMKLPDDSDESTEEDYLKD